MVIIVSSNCSSARSNLECVQVRGCSSKHSMHVQMCVFVLHCTCMHDCMSTGGLNHTPCCLNHTPCYQSLAYLIAAIHSLCNDPLHGVHPLSLSGGEHLFHLSLSTGPAHLELCQLTFIDLRLFQQSPVHESV